MNSNKRAAQSAFFNLRILITLLLCAVAACSLVSRPLLAFFRPEASTKDSQRTLTFAERVAYQRAIEEVFPTISDPATGCTPDTWANTTTINTPSARYGHTAVWTGSQMIVWGGQDNDNALNSGGRYGIDIWISTATANAPTARDLHTAVWTGSEMIVWGGYGSGMSWNTGGKYNPDTNSWLPTSTTNAPAARYGHTAVWTGSEMIVWGGVGSGVLNTGGRYNPATDTWTDISTTNAPAARWGHTAVCLRRHRARSLCGCLPDAQHKSLP